MGRVRTVPALLVGKWRAQACGSQSCCAKPYSFTLHSDHWHRTGDPKLTGSEGLSHLLSPETSTEAVTPIPMLRAGRTAGSRLGMPVADTHRGHPALSGWGHCLECCSTQDIPQRTSQLHVHSARMGVGGGTTLGLVAQLPIQPLSLPGN